MREAAGGALYVQVRPLAALRGCEAPPLVTVHAQVAGSEVAAEHSTTPSDSSCRRDGVRAVKTEALNQTELESALCTPVGTTVLPIGCWAVLRSSTQVFPYTARVGAPLVPPGRRASLKSKLLRRAPVTVQVGSDEEGYRVEVTMDEFWAYMSRDRFAHVSPRCRLT